MNMYRIGVLRRDRTHAHKKLTHHKELETTVTPHVLFLLCVDLRDVEQKVNTNTQTHKHTNTQTTMGADDEEGDASKKLRTQLTSM